eukprot:GHVT01042782.1.p1 GENE.GHVT01042782.1~~GHVT01042782.1.p1  ORF type:complete len:133 (-),score=19.38 GHVT01042782.1:105-503(-)
MICFGCAWLLGCGALHSLVAGRRFPFGWLQAMEVGVGGYSSVQMNGREVFKFATRQVPQAVTHALEAAGVSLQEVDWLLLHQANSRIMRAVADKLGIPYNKVTANDTYSYQLLLLPITATYSYYYYSYYCYY